MLAESLYLLQRDAEKSVQQEGAQLISHFSTGVRVISFGRTDYHDRAAALI